MTIVILMSFLVGMGTSTRQGEALSASYLTDDEARFDRLGEVTQEDWRDIFCQENYRKALDQIKFHEALESIWQLISFCDEYIEKNKPWQLIKEQKTKGKEQKLKEILSDLLVSLEEIASLLEPFLPETSQKIVNQLQKNKKTEVLFPRL